MREAITTRPSPAMLVALVALFVALSGSAMAMRLAANSVKSKHIANGQVKGADLAANAVSGAKLATGAVTGRAVAPGTLNGSHVGDDLLTGADISEGSLDQVPSAAESDSSGETTRVTNGLTSLDLGGLIPNVDGTNYNPSPDLSLTATPTLVGSGIAFSDAQYDKNVLVHASLNLYSASGAGSAKCVAEIANVANGYTPMSNEAYADFPATGHDVQVPVVGIVSNWIKSLESVRITCTELSGDIRFDRGDVTVLTLPAL